MFSDSCIQICTKCMTQVGPLCNFLHHRKESFSSTLGDRHVHTVSCMRLHPGIIVIQHRLSGIGTQS